MSDRRRTLVLSLFHTLLAAVVLAPLYRVLLAVDRSDFPLIVDVAFLAYLAFVAWWETRRAISTSPDRQSLTVNGHIVAGARRGGVGGVLYIWGILAVLFVWGVKVALFGPHPHEWALVWEEWPSSG